MDRRDFLWVTASAGAGVAAVGAPSFFTAPAAVADIQKGGGRAMVAEPLTARISHGSFPFSLARFASDTGLITTAKRAPSASAPALRSPLRDLQFNGFANGAGKFINDHLNVVAVHHSIDGFVARHDMWSHATARTNSGGGGTSAGVVFTAHDDALAGFEITYMPANGATTSGFFGFMASGSGPQFRPGVYVLAGQSAATGVAPDLGLFAYSGEARAPRAGARLRVFELCCAW
jgi:hypothetical protein